ncbi:hypothetical protein QBC46DRAFT_347661 [Diplogelasinospora grovesii]|uniref:Uncharacterized protein n=1 Tax=Diplogelasinospora grovesii TaxID=303347 RepID=A0AAN6MXQ9_9PEZI|nr:hypothetical protein QBC46DRAFT_347661 [Diplogelasinospora grovesii]
MENNRQSTGERCQRHQMAFNANHPGHAEQAASSSPSQQLNREHTYQSHQDANHTHHYTYHTHQDVFYSPPVIPQAIVAAYEPIPQPSADNNTTPMIPPPGWDIHPSLSSAPDFSPSASFSTPMDPRLSSHAWDPQVPTNSPISGYISDQIESWFSYPPRAPIYADPAVISARLSARAPTDSYAAAASGAPWPYLTQGSEDVFMEPEAHDGEVALRVLRRAMQRRRAILDARRASEQARTAPPSASYANHTGEEEPNLFLSRYNPYDPRFDF